MVDDFRTLVQALLPTRQLAVKHVWRAAFAQREGAELALWTGPAARCDRHDDVITECQVVHAVADGINDTGTLVPQHDRQRRGHRAAIDRQIRATYPDCAHLDPEFTLPGLRQIEILEADRADFAQDRSTHLGSPL